VNTYEVAEDCRAGLSKLLERANMGISSFANDPKTSHRGLDNVAASYPGSFLPLVSIHKCFAGVY
jgi:hypothetical protein